MKIQGKKVESPKLSSSLAASFGLALDEGVLKLPELGPDCAIRLRRLSHPAYLEVVRESSAGDAESTTNILSTIVQVEGARQIFEARGKRKKKANARDFGDTDRIMSRFEAELRANPQHLVSTDPDRRILNAALGLILGWDAMPLADGAFTLDNVLALLGWRGYKLVPCADHSVTLGTDPKYLTAKAAEDLTEDDVTAKLIESGAYEVTEFAGPLSVNGRAVTIAVRVEYEDETVTENPILSEWILDRIYERAEELDTEREQNVALVHSDSTDGRVGSPAD